MKNRIKIGVFMVLFGLLGLSCTDLIEERIDETEFGAEADAINGAIAPAYGYISWTWRHTNYFGLQEVSSDEAILPYRGGTDWFDGGKFIAAHQHNFTPSNDLIGSGWNQVTINISRTLSAIEVLTPLSEEGNVDATAALYEMKALRAYLNMLMLDSWGVVFKKESSDALSEVLRTDEAIAYIESELLSVVDVINDNKGPGRITQNAVNGFLARLYLNAAIYRDPYGTANFTDEDMDKVIAYTDQIINSGSYDLSPEYFELFNDDNNTNSELIFALDQRGVLNREHSRWAYWSIAGAMIARPEFYPDNTADGTDGPAVSPDFYQTWVDAYNDVDPAEADARFYQRNTMVPDIQLNDLENREPLLETETENSYYCVDAQEFEMDRGILRGIQWGPRRGDGDLEKCEDGSVRIYPLQQTKGNGPDRDTGYVDHTLQVDFSNMGSLHHAGYRFSKYQYSRTSPNGNGYSSVDLVLMRLAEIYLMRAEAKLRKGDNAGALADVNMVRTSRTARPEQTPEALSTLDLDILFRERGFELYWEGFRRTDQIRFGKYEDSWTEKTDSDVNHRLFPIPQSAVDGASGIDGFLTQNQGY
ncbi:RagB/SusD family nutrient uptake outer membrane protein [Aurantibacter crassamenti]|uniref:RagB/SusD family nutrient uptake outer membrane protein n=1 Tax=Aurantibacter crassamenti TaxID=1837375 RepID=UPI00193AAD1C|nr:RagB/SusD family nutrient uptake outer membrane protein [Aurantibacter crassamenti]MBM1105078.1 RagB/SusD family nutrient uptake outer membrane protein [Aurantibacter crassamenti]